MWRSHNSIVSSCQICLERSLPSGALLLDKSFHRAWLEESGLDKLT